MRIIMGLIARIAAVTLLCLAAAAVYVTMSTDRDLKAETEASARRVVREMRFDAWRQLIWRGSDTQVSTISVPDLSAARWLQLISPGVCISLRPPAGADAEPRSLCGALSGVGPAAPDWFEAVYPHLFAPGPTVTRAVLVDGREEGVLQATADPGARVRQVWQRIHVSIGVAAAMAAATAILASLAIGRALWPAGLIVGALRRIGRGDYAVRLPSFRTTGLDSIARAVEDLGQKLACVTREREELLRRVFDVQEHERRVIARGLHDEFGQCLVAIEARAAVLEADLEAHQGIDDARAIRDTATRMMGSLRTALAQLRPPELSELGLVSALRQLIGRLRGAFPTAHCRIESPSALPALPSGIDLVLYRVAQEALTNALRHGRAQNVVLQVAYSRVAGTARLSVEDDGGGDPACLTGSDGYGLLGLRERVTAHGGSLKVERGAAGFRLAAVLPVGRSVAAATS